MTEALAGTRRERLRTATLAEIKAHALTQLAAGGPEALSLNAISRAMRMSGPALYRYFASRDQLLAVLVAESYDELADALGAATAAAPAQEPAARFRAVAAAYREWATANPHRYQLVFASRYGSGLHAPEATIPAAHRSMSVVLDAMSALSTRAGSDAAPGSAALGGQLEDWAGSRPGRAAPSAATLQLGLLAWTRLHGLVSLEIGGSFAVMGLDPALLYAAEVDHLVAQATGD